MKAPPQSGVSILEALDLAVARAGVQILDVPALKVTGGEVLALIGPNGSGKSTLLLALSSIVPPDSGRLLFKGETVHPGSGSLGYRRRIAMVFQEPLLLNTTVFSNVSAGLRIRGLDRDEIGRRVKMSLDRFRIGHLAHRSARTLSGGEAQRASLARALATEPEVLLLDEPFANLDPPTREALLDDLERTLRQTGTTAVFATHDRVEALRLADRIAVMQNGMIVQIGPPDEVMNRPVDEFVASFVGVETIALGTVTSSVDGALKVRVGERTVSAVDDVESGAEVALCIRPENVTLHPPDSDPRGSARNRFAGKIVRMVPAGHYVRAQVDCGFPLTALVTNQSIEEMALEEGKAVTASFKATAIHLIRRGSAPRR